MKLIDQALACVGLRRIKKLHNVHVRLAPIDPEQARAFAAAIRKASAETRQRHAQ